MPPVMAAVASNLAGKRDRRMLERHLRHCKPCRREAYTIGLQPPFTGAGRVRDAFSKAAALLPLPWVIRQRIDPPADAASAGSISAGPAHNAMAHLSSIGSVGVEQTASAMQKAVAVVAVAAMAGGGGLVANKAGVDLPLPRLGASATEKATASDQVPAGMEASKGLSQGAAADGANGGPPSTDANGNVLSGPGSAGGLAPGADSTAPGAADAPGTVGAPESGLSPSDPGAG